MMLAMKLTHTKKNEYKPNFKIFIDSESGQIGNIYSIYSKYTYIKAFDRLVT
jgi:hypothetical protein